MGEKDKAARSRAARSSRDDKKAAGKGPAAGKAGRPDAATRKAGGARVAGPTIVEIPDTDGGIIDKAADEKDTIDAIVSPRTDDPTARIVGGARVRNCAQCLADVFVAPSTFAFFKGRAMPPIWCVQCAMLAAETHGKRSRAGRA